MTTPPQSQPILFSGEMVRAILAGKKTQTRRVVSARNSEVLGVPGSQLWSHLHFDYDENGYRTTVDGPNDTMFGSGPNCQYLHVPAWNPLDGEFGIATYRVRPKIVPGDWLWVRETWCEYGSRYIYRADYDRLTPISDGIGGPWKPSIHMPRAASRITLEVTEVRVERVQEISGKDIIAEGAVERPHEVDKLGRCPVSAFDGCVYLDLRTLWANAWDRINGKKPGHAWADNPWVWVIEFRRINELQASTPEACEGWLHSPKREVPQPAAARGNTR